MNDHISVYHRERGQATIGLLVMVLFIASLVLLNSPDISISNKVAYATGGALLGGGGGGSPATLESLAQPKAAVSSDVRKALVSSTAKVVQGIVSTVTKMKAAGTLEQNRSALVALISQTINLIQKVILVLRAGS
jgi:hypothetical protein